MDWTLQIETHSLFGRLLLEHNSGRSSEDPCLANRWSSSWFLLGGQWYHCHQCSSLASLHRSSIPSEQMDQEHGTWQSPLRSETARSQLRSNLGELHSIRYSRSLGEYQRRVRSGLGQRPAQSHLQTARSRSMSVKSLRETICWSSSSTSNSVRTSLSTRVISAFTSPRNCVIRTTYLKPRWKWRWSTSWSLPKVYRINCWALSQRRRNQNWKNRRTPWLFNQPRINANKRKSKTRFWKSFRPRR